MTARTLAEIDADLKRLSDKVADLCREFGWLAEEHRKLRDEDRKPGER